MQSDLKVTSYHGAVSHFKKHTKIICTSHIERLIIIVAKDSRDHKFLSTWSINKNLWHFNWLYQLCEEHVDFYGSVIPFAYRVPYEEHLRRTNWDFFLFYPTDSSYYKWKDQICKSRVWENSIKNKRFTPGKQISIGHSNNVHIKRLEQIHKINFRYNICACISGMREW